MGELTIVDGTRQARGIAWCSYSGPRTPWQSPQNTHAFCARKQVRPQFLLCLNVCVSECVTCSCRYPASSHKPVSYTAGRGSIKPRGSSLPYLHSSCLCVPEILSCSGVPTSLVSTGSSLTIKAVIQRHGLSLVHIHATQRELSMQKATAHQIWYETSRLLHLPLR